MSQGHTVNKACQRRWNVDGTELTQNWKNLLLSVRLAQVRTTPVTTVDAITARINIRDGGPSAREPNGTTGGVMN